MSTSILYLPDYSGIEMRLIAEASGETELIKMFQDDPVNADPHTIAAELFYGDMFTDPDRCIDFMLNKDKNNKNLMDKIGKDAALKKFKKTMRGAAKNASFAKAYIARLPKLLKTLMLTYEQAEPGYHRYEQRWPKVFHYSDNVIKEVREKGYIETPFGPYLYAPSDQLYILGNYKIQNMAAKILKRAIVRCHYFFKEVFDGEVKTILDIHDELVIDYPRKFLCREKEFISGVTNLMTECKEIKVPLAVGWKKTTTTWDRAKEFII
jgi:DNA polymerase I